MKTIDFEHHGKKYICKKLNAKQQLKIASRLSRGSGEIISLGDHDLDYVVGKLLGTLSTQDDTTKMWSSIVTNDTPEYELMDETMSLKLLNELTRKVADIHFEDFSEGAPSGSA